MVQAAAPRRHDPIADMRPRSVFGFSWRESGEHQLGLCLLAVLILPLAMVPLELQRRIIDRATADQNLDLLLWLGALYLGTVVLEGSLKYLLRVYRGFVSERAMLRLRRAVHGQAGRDEHGETVSIIASKVERVGGFVGEAFSEPILQGGLLVAVLGYMLVVEPTTALVSLAFFLPQVLLVPLIQRQPARPAQGRARARAGPADRRQCRPRRLRADCAGGLRYPDVLLQVEVLVQAADY